ncbi:MAG: putative DNA-binding transcriptional activator of the family, partial [Frankiales bacterium]|nr:putative DNA-binding transcriptional activator of the family [Frankiales bacterium]
LSDLPICLLGGLRLVRAGAEVALSPAEQRLVVLLALRGPLLRSQVHARLWPDKDERHASAALRTQLWRLRRDVAGLVQVNSELLSLDPSLPVDVEELADRARRDGPARSDDPLPAAQLLPESDDTWVLEDRPRVLQQQVHVLERTGEALLAAGRPAQALEHAYAVLRLDPLRESAHRLVLRVHLAEGNLVQAVRSYEEFAALLDAELGVLPSPLMRSLLP